MEIFSYQNIDGDGWTGNDLFTLLERLDAINSNEVQGFSSISSVFKKAFQKMNLANVEKYVNKVKTVFVLSQFCFFRQNWYFIL